MVVLPVLHDIRMHMPYHIKVIVLLSLIDVERAQDPASPRAGCYYYVAMLGSSLGEGHMVVEA